MMKFFFFVLILFFTVRLNAQGFVKEADSTSKLQVEDFAYPTFLDGETHSNFTVGYEFDPKFLVELQGFYDSYRLNDVSETRLRSKNYLSDKFYLFSGVGLETEIDKHGFFKPLPPRIKLLNGFGYDVDEKFSFEVRQDLHFNKTNFGNYGTPNLFSLGGKYKF